MTIKISIIGIVLFAIQISLATFYNTSIDLKIVIGVATLTFAYIIYKHLTKNTTHADQQFMVYNATKSKR